MQLNKKKMEPNQNILYITYLFIAEKDVKEILVA